MYQYLASDGEVVVENNQGYYVDFWVANWHVLNMYLEF